MAGLRRLFHHSIAVHNGEVPFTLAHAAAALPFRGQPLRRLCLVPSALVIGTLAPDFEYFLRLSPGGRLGHTLPGALLFSLPMALLVLWLFHTFIKLPAVRLLPESLQRRLTPHLHLFRFRGVARFLWIIASILVGIATHLAWDSFTHSTTWLYRHWSALRQPHRLPILGQIPLYKILQHGSTIVGLTILLVWFCFWYRSAPAANQILGTQISSARKVAVIGVITAVAFLTAMLRGLAGLVIPAVHHHTFSRSVGEAVAAGMALFWWQLLIYGIYSSRVLWPRPKPEAVA
jgi:Domain of unknown function (DUF4184)